MTWEVVKGVFKDFKCGFAKRLNRLVVSLQPCLKNHALFSIPHRQNDTKTKTGLLFSATKNDAEQEHKGGLVDFFLLLLSSAPFLMARPLNGGMSEWA